MFWIRENRFQLGCRARWTRSLRRYWFRRGGLTCPCHSARLLQQRWLRHRGLGLGWCPFGRIGIPSLGRRVRTCDLCLWRLSKFLRGVSVLTLGGRTTSPYHRACPLAVDSHALTMAVGTAECGFLVRYSARLYAGIVGTLHD